jgi:hypothetical protein
MQDNEDNVTASGGPRPEILDTAPDADNDEQAVNVAALSLQDLQRFEQVRSVYFHPQPFISFLM